MKEKEKEKGERFGVRGKEKERRKDNAFKIKMAEFLISIRRKNYYKNIRRCVSM